MHRSINKFARIYLTLSVLPRILTLPYRELDVKVVEIDDRHPILSNDYVFNTELPFYGTRNYTNCVEKLAGIDTYLLRVLLIYRLAIFLDLSLTVRCRF